MDQEKARATVKIGSDRSFAFVFTAVFLIIACWPLWQGGAVRLWALGAALLLVGIGIIFPRILRPLNIAWFKFGMWISRFTTPVFMALVFILAVVPTGLLLRLFGKDPMRRKIDNAADTYWLEREDQPGPMQEQY